VPHVRQGVRGPKKMGCSPFQRFKSLRVCSESIGKTSFSAHVRWAKGAPVQNHTPWLEIQSKRIERITRRHQDVLSSVKHVRFHCIRYLAEVRMP
jgi:hypothetical protein